MKDRTLRPFSIHMFLPDGSADGLRIIGKSNWTGIGVLVPRATLDRARKRDEFKRTGIYILAGQDDRTDETTVYVGQGDPIGPRLDSHLSSKDFWTSATFFVTRDDSLNKAHIGYLESRLIRIATELKRVKLDNANSPQVPGLSEADVADMESFLEDMLAILPLIGIDAFEAPPMLEPERLILFLTGKGIHAQGYESAQGFVVQAGSEAVIEETPSLQPFQSALRKRLIEQFVMSLDEDSRCFKFNQDFVFRSSSTAASVLLARSASGPQEWKDDNDRLLRFIHQSEASSS